MLLRPLWLNTDPNHIHDWRLFSNDLLQFLLDKQLDAVTGMGHSIGAIVTLRAALKEPEHFRALILLDPVLFPPRYMLKWGITRLLQNRYRYNSRIGVTLKRRRFFDDLEQVFAGYRRRDIFRFISDEHLRILIKGMTKPRREGGYELVFSPEWEARIYYTAAWRDWDLWRGIPKLNIPTIIIRGAETDTFLDSTAKAVSQRNSHIRIVTLENASHLLPFEKPDEVFEIVQAFMEEVV